MGTRKPVTEPGTGKLRGNARRDRGRETGIPLGTVPSANGLSLKRNPARDNFARLATARETRQREGTARQSERTAPEPGLRESGQPKPRARPIPQEPGSAQSGQPNPLGNSGERGNTARRDRSTDRAARQRGSVTGASNRSGASQASRTAQNHTPGTGQRGNAVKRDQAARPETTR